MGRYSNISVSQAERLIQRRLTPSRTVSVPLAEAVGRILREPVRADRPLPPFDRVTMDGVALSYDAWNRGCREFRIEGIQRAGEPALRRRSLVGCIEVMTGAVLPRGCDCVVPVEDLEIRDGWARVTSDTLARGDSIHPRGSDCSKGAILLRPGRILDGPSIAVAASVGKSVIKVAQAPRIGIVSTGDELVEVDQHPLAHQIRRSNPHALAASLRLHGFHDLSLDHVPDQPDAQRKVLRKLLDQSDVLLITGGVSKGRYDFIPDTLKQLGVNTVFHRVRQRPGRPMWFGRTPDGKLVFGLPGNPASCLVCLHRYLLPLLAGSDRRPHPSIALTRPMRRGPVTIFQPVRNGKPVTLNTSGDFVDLAQTDGFIEIPEGTGYLRRVQYWSWR
jgi:molybdopterin molybdotransferase